MVEMLRVKRKRCASQAYSVLSFFRMVGLITVVIVAHVVVALSVVKLTFARLHGQPKEIQESENPFAEAG